MKILVTGGAGFIGSHLVKNLVEKGHEVIVLDILLRGNKIDKDIFDSIEFVRGDVRDKVLVNQLSVKCDRIYHFAAILGVDIVTANPVETMNTEITGMHNVTDAAIINDVPGIIYASTSGVYGHSAIQQSMKETFRLDPCTSYAIAKRYNEVYLAALYEEKGLKSISLRFFNIYGVKQDSRMVIPRFFQQALSGHPITIFNDGNQTRDFTYIEDTIIACEKLATTMQGCEIYNISSETEISIGELARRIKNITNSSSEIKYINTPIKRYNYEVSNRVGNTDKLYKAIQYKPSTILQEGLSKIYNYSRSLKQVDLEQNLLLDDYIL